MYRLVFLTKDVEAGREDEKRTSRKIHGSTEGGHAEGCCVGEDVRNRVMWRQMIRCGDDSSRKLCKKWS